MNLYERIESLCADRGINITTMCKECEISRGSLTDLKKGRTTTLSSQTLSKIADYFGITVDYLLGKNTQPQSDATTLPQNVRPIRTQSLPIFSSPYLPRSMGFEIKQPNASPLPSVNPYLRVSNAQPIFADDTYETFTDANASIEADFCLVAQDDSMIGARIQAGDVVFIRSQDTIENKQIAAVTIDGVAVLRRWHYYPDTAKLVLSSENPAYEPLVYVGDELNAVRCLGLAVCFMSNL